MALPRKVKYIIDDVDNQLIKGNLNISGTLKSNNTGIYRALLTQTGELTGYDLTDFNNGLIVGESYRISDYKDGDDFSNIADVLSGEINADNCIFKAIGQVPKVWSNNSILNSGGGLIIDVLENTLGYDLYWSWVPFGGSGYYVAVNETTGPVYNSFQRDKIQIIVPLKYSFSGNGFPPFITPSVTSFDSKDDLIRIDVWDVSSGPGFSYADNLLYYTPIEIKINQDTDISPVEIYGEVIPSFPLSSAYVSLLSNETNVQDFYCNNTSSVNNMTELITLLNNDAINVFEFLYAEDSMGGIKITMPENVKNQFCPNGTLTFQINGDN